MPNNTPAPADLVEAVAKALCESLQADADAGDVGIVENFDLDPAYWQNTAQAAITAMQAHMASDGVIQSDRIAGAAMFRSASGWAHESNAERHILSGKGDDSPFVTMFAAHRRAAAGVALDCLWARNGHDPCVTPQPDPRDAVGTVSKVDMDRATKIAKKFRGDYDDYAYLVRELAAHRSTEFNKFGRRLRKLADRVEKHAGDAINETAYANSFDGPTERRADQARVRANKAEQAMLKGFDEIRNALANSEGK